MRGFPSGRWRLALAATAILLLTVSAFAQFGRGFGFNARVATERDFDGKFHYCRVMYRGGFRGTGGSWTTDYPMADINLMIRLSELTRINVSKGPGGEPNHLIVRLGSPELFQCP